MPSKFKLFYYSMTSVTKWECLIIYDALSTNFSDYYTHYCFIQNHLGIFPLDKWQVKHFTGRGISTEYTYHVAIFLASVYTPYGSRFPEESIWSQHTIWILFCDVYWCFFGNVGISLLSIWILSTFCRLW